MARDEANTNKGNLTKNKGDMIAHQAKLDKHGEPANDEKQTNKRSKNDKTDFERSKRVKTD